MTFPDKESPAADSAELPGVRTVTHYALPTDLQVEQWTRICRSLQRHRESNQWWIGDVLAAGVRRYGITYRKVSEITGLSVGSVKNRVSVSSSVEPSRRRDDLSFAHHATVASMAPADQEMWLKSAAEEKWSDRKLRALIKQHREAANGVGQASETLEEQHQSPAFTVVLDPSLKPTAPVIKLVQDRVAAGTLSGVDLLERVECLVRAAKGIGCDQEQIQEIDQVASAWVSAALSNDLGGGDRNRFGCYFRLDDCFIQYESNLKATYWIYEDDGDSAGDDVPEQPRHSLVIRPATSRWTARRKREECARSADLGREEALENEAALRRWADDGGNLQPHGGDHP